MTFSAAMFTRAKTIVIGMLALLLLVTPVCGALCKAQACALPKAAEKSPCHESASAMANENGSSLRSERNCGLPELPVALPADFRSLRSDSAASANAVAPIAAHASSFGFKYPIHCTDLQDWRGTTELLDISPSSTTPLRL